MNSSLIIQRFNDWRTSRMPVALITVVETIGSTYSKAGHRILIADSGDYQGLVSGGCLEGDLAEHAADVLRKDEARIVTYDLRDDADELFGLGVGCDGLLRILIQPMRAATGYQPFAAIADAMLAEGPGAVATVIEPGDSGEPVGATLVHGDGAPLCHLLSAAAAERLAALCERARETQSTGIETLPGGCRVLVSVVPPVPKLLVLGAGLDAIPLVAMACRLGWRVHLGDHRPAYLDREPFAAASAVSEVVPGNIGAAFDIAGFDAIIVMSHHLATDEAYLRELAAFEPKYIGVLGPRARRRKLLDAIGAAGTGFGARLRGPVGLDLGADSPETIALSILAEIQQVLAGKGAARPV